MGCSLRAFGGRNMDVVKQAWKERIIGRKEERLCGEGRVRCGEEAW